MAGTSGDRGGTQHFSPEQIRPFSKAGPRKPIQANRKRCRTSILTDTPEKNERERDATERGKRRQRGTKQKDKPESSESELEADTSDLVEDSDQSDSSNHEINIKAQDYVLVKLGTKKVCRHYVGIVLTDPDEDDTVEIKFLSRMLSKSQPVFCYPDKEDIAEVDVDDIVRKLPFPNLVGGTKRTSQQYVFDYEFSDFYRLY